MLVRYWIAVLIAVTWLPVVAAQDLRAGRSAVKITPPKGMPMAGYYHVRLNEGVHDDLFSKALVLEVNGERAALVALDLVSAPRPLVEAARKQIQERSGLPPERIMISATHSHTGPEMGGRLRGVDPATEKLAKDYHGKLPGLIAESVARAIADLQPVRARVGVGQEDAVAFIRRFRMQDGTVGWNPGKLNPKIVHPMGSIDPAVPVVYFESPDRKPLLTYVNYANHLDTVGGMEFSADYPYTIGRMLAEVRGPDMVTMFTIGTAGNINHIDVKNGEPQKGHSEAARIGTILAGEVLRTFRHMKAVSPGPVRAKSRVIVLPKSHYDPADVAKAREVVSRYGKPGADPFYTQVHSFKVLDLEARGSEPLEAEVQVISLGQEIAWVGLPGEIFVEHGKAIKLASPFPVTIIAELANGSLGYVPDRRAYAEGAYEVISARVGPGAGEQLVAEAVKQLVDAYNGR